MYRHRTPRSGAAALERLGRPERLRRGHYLALARRKSRRAERAALQARLVLARIAVTRDPHGQTRQPNQERNPPP